MDVKEYLVKHKVEEITNGQSGAGVYMIDGEYILKHVKKEKLDSKVFDTYKREALFYQEKKGKNLFVPVIKELELSDDEIILIMKKYSELNRADIDDELISKIANLLAGVHGSDIPGFLNDNSDKQKLVSDNGIEDCVNGWKSVLNEHEGVFSEGILNDVAANINDIISLKNKEKSVLVHGDFHWENILKDDSGNLILCDWQGVKVGGPSEDLSFFLSRLGADGVNIDEDGFLNAYGDAYQKIFDEKVDVTEIKKYMWASRVITTFLYWHFFLHGSDVERVREVYENMNLVDTQEL
ncbi:Thiamine kinase [Eubacterium uniforme]|uniref:Thiamine kinase n=1 Tax=Eubacterium uniforme TaxID=39495 RepID=A0A1T4VQ39_9FIRM|nr:phosphotransferase [Eubacterium uniforme]SKA67067.1 Thiamine kinase [Eubacterium uniforme]